VKWGENKSESERDFMIGGHIRDTRFHIQGGRVCYLVKITQLKTPFQWFN